MVRFLSPEWVRALDDLAKDVDLQGVDVDGVVVAYDIDGFGYRVVFSDSGVRVLEGAHDATVTIRADRPTAAAIARGELSAQRAFMAGRLRLGGDAAALIRAQPAIAALPDLFESVRPRTEW